MVDNTNIDNTKERYNQYLLTFVKVMPERAKIFQRLVGQKRELDAKLQSGGQDVARQLLALVGETSQGDPNNPTLQYMAWKVDKSLQFFLRRYPAILEKTKDWTKENPALTNLMGPVAALHEEFEKLLGDHHEGVYVKQAALLKSIVSAKGKEVSQHVNVYLASLKDEQTILDNIKARAKQLVPFQNNIAGYLGRLARSAASSQGLTAGVSAVASLAMFAGIILSFVMAAAFSSSDIPTEANPDIMLAQVTAMFSALGGAGLAALATNQWASAWGKYTV